MKYFHIRIFYLLCQVKALSDLVNPPVSSSSSWRSKETRSVSGRLSPVVSRLLLMVLMLSEDWLLRTL